MCTNNRKFMRPKILILNILSQNWAYRMAQNFGGRKLWRIAANKHFSRQNIGGLAALHSKIARIKAFGG